MPPVEKKRRNKRFAEWEEKPVKDFDPENEVPDQSENSDSEDSADERTGTEHYVSVGKSKLRQKESITLGPEYRGARVSRAALEQSSDEEDEDDDDQEEAESEEEEEEFADPDTADLKLDHVDDDAEISSDDALGESDNEKLQGFVFRGSSKPLQPLSKNLARRPKASDFMRVGESEEEEGSEQDGVTISGSGEEQDEEDISDEDDMEEDSGDEEEDSEMEREGAMLFDDEAEVTDDDSGDDEEEDESEDDEEEDDDDERAEMRRAMGNDDDVKSDIRKAMSDGLKTVVSTISQAAKQEAEQGAAVRTQRRAFDSILNLRIRLQKALIAANTFHVVEKEDDADDAGSEVYQAAEEAAVKLWNTIDSVRESLAPPTKTGEKRKREAIISLDTSSQDIWASMQSLESLALSRRRKVLDKWSAKVRLEAGGLTKTRRLVDAGSSSLVSVLEDQLLSNSDRHIKRARTPRSCAPAQAAKKVEEDEKIYDDADFYQLLLKELVDQRSSDAAAPGGQHVATVRWAALKEAKTRKVVDRKASKGRKLRYTVHEKLQNFMAPEDRRRWDEHAVDRLFGALFGQKMVLGEEEDGEEEDAEMGGVGVEDEGLRLFRS